MNQELPAPILLPQQVIAARRRQAGEQRPQEAMLRSHRARTGTCTGARARVAPWLHNLGWRGEHWRQLAWVAGQDRKPVHTIVKA